MSEATKAATGKGGKPKAKLLIIVGIVLAALLAGGGAAAFLFSKKGHDEAAAAEEAEAEAEQHDAPKSNKTRRAQKPKSDGPPLFVTLDPFTVNLADSDADRIAQIQFVLEITEESADEELKAQLPAVRNAILLLLSSKSARELLTLEGKERLATEVSEATGKRVGGNRIQSVHFAKFIVQ